MGRDTNGDKEDMTTPKQAPQGLGRLMRTGVAAGLVAWTCALAAPAMAQNDKMTPIAIPAPPNAIVLNTGPLPGATAQ